MSKEEKAREYAQYNGVMPHAKFTEHKAFWIKTFIKGADWMEQEKNAEIAQIKAQLRWRKVSEGEYPEVDQDVLLKQIHEDGSVEYDTGYLHTGDSKIFICGSLTRVDEWQPINP
ncbi:hypothetical protein JGH11_17015 [Dysgonomonas sp. Marseille-P4677]|uniref:hypothetical protein n=1 Tax=Dysgonomonas sp. Marseille-P4677 TaxID=2364790 RepID=UPI001913FE61|nr:hypothetical protein [Dysgonomonas sp. Marseille-P4677]MBK5722577.1 hypothetical protein [Dysgonomonas sp. Marseille-P4677]